MTGSEPLQVPALSQHLTHPDSNMPTMIYKNYFKVYKPATSRTLWVTFQLEKPISLQMTHNNQ